MKTLYWATNNLNRGELFKNFLVDTIPNLILETHRKDLTKTSDIEQYLIVKNRTFNTPEKLGVIQDFLIEGDKFPEYMLNYSGILNFEPVLLTHEFLDNPTNGLLINIDSSKRQMTLLQKQQVKVIDKDCSNVARDIRRTLGFTDPTIEDCIYLIKFVSSILQRFYPLISNTLVDYEIQSIEDSIYYNRLNCSTLNHWLCRYLYQLGVPATKLPVITPTGEDHSILLFRNDYYYYVIDTQLALLTNNPTYLNPTLFDFKKSRFLYNYTIPDNINLQEMKFILDKLNNKLQKEVL